MFKQHKAFKRISLAAFVALAFWTLYTFFYIPFHYGNLNKLLLLAVYTHDRNQVNALLNAGANANAKTERKAAALFPPYCALPANSDGTPVLLIASREKQHGIVILLLDKGADVNIRNAVGDTALVWAARTNQNNIALVLLNRGANPDLHHQGGFSPLMCYVANGDEHLTQILLDKGCDIDYQDADGNSALSLAKHYHNTHIEQMLLGREDKQAHF